MAWSGSYQWGEKSPERTFSLDTLGTDAQGKGECGPGDHTRKLTLRHAARLVETAEPNICPVSPILLGHEDLHLPVGGALELLL